MKCLSFIKLSSVYKLLKRTLYHLGRGVFLCETCKLYLEKQFHVVISDRGCCNCYFAFAFFYFNLFHLLLVGVS